MSKGFSEGLGEDFDPGFEIDYSIYFLVNNLAARLVDDVTKDGESRLIEDDRYFDPGVELSAETIDALVTFLREQQKSGELSGEQESCIGDLEKCLIAGKEVPITITQVFVNAALRQVMANIKMGIDTGFSPFKDGISGLFKGWKTRAFGNFISMLPASKIADSLQGKGLITQCVVASCTETLMSPLEVAAIRKNLEAKLALDLSKKVPSMIIAASPFYFARNFATWASASAEIERDDKADAITHRAMLGFITGAASSIPDTLANKVLVEVAKFKSSKSTEVVQECVKRVFQEIARDPKLFLTTVIKSSPFRAIGGTFTAILFSEEGNDLVEDFAKVIGVASRDTIDFLGSPEFLESFLDHSSREMDVSCEDKYYEGLPIVALVKFSESLLRNFYKNMKSDHVSLDHSDDKYLEVEEALAGFGDIFLRNLQKEISSDSLVLEFERIAKEDLSEEHGAKAIGKVGVTIPQKKLFGGLDFVPMRPRIDHIMIPKMVPPSPRVMPMIAGEGENALGEKSFSERLLKNFTKQLDPFR